MATHGHGWAKRIVLGSVADHLRHNTDVPLLLLKGGAGELSPGAPRAKISPSADSAAGSAGAVAGEGDEWFRARLTSSSACRSHTSSALRDFLAERCRRARPPLLSSTWAPVSLWMTWVNSGL